VRRVSFFDDESDLSQDVGEADPEIALILGAELDRQSETPEMIASESFTSVAVLQATGSVITNAYGMRIVTAALTTRGLREEEMREIGRIIAAALRPDADEARLDEPAERSRALGGRFPLYPRAAARSAVGG
jgi:glycine/serine hydroxymethyltransferase